MRHVAMLRAVNVGGRILPMAQARALCEGLGFSDVASLLQSGNLIFDSARLTGTKLETALELEAQRRLGLQTEFFVRTPAQWAAAVGANPFPKQAKSEPGYLHVVVLKDAVKTAAVAALQRAIKGNERVDGDGKQIYVVYPDGAGRSKLTLKVMEKHLGTQGTARNWNTALKILAALERD